MGGCKRWAFVGRHPRQHGQRIHAQSRGGWLFPVRLPQARLWRPGPLALLCDHSRDPLLHAVDGAAGRGAGGARRRAGAQRLSRQRPERRRGEERRTSSELAALLSLCEGPMGSAQPATPVPLQEPRTAACPWPGSDPHLPLLPPRYCLPSWAPSPLHDSNKPCLIATSSPTVASWAQPQPQHADRRRGGPTGGSSHRVLHRGCRPLHRGRRPRPTGARAVCRAAGRCRSWVSWHVLRLCACLPCHIRSCLRRRPGTPRGLPGLLPPAFPRASQPLPLRALPWPLGLQARPARGEGAVAEGGPTR